MAETLQAKDYALIDLHLHLDGSLSLESIKALAVMQKMEIPGDYTLMNMIQAGPDCKDLNEYLEKFSFPCSLLQTEAAISAAVYALAEELKAQGLLYAEIRFAPQKHTNLGLTQDQVMAAAIDGLRRSDFKAGLILCCMRGNEIDAENRETIRVARKYLGQGVCAVDLAGAEALFPTAHFGDLFSLARELGVPCTIHAGEADGPESIRAALSLGALRLGHGVRAVEDAALMKELAQRKIPLELCPTSNLNTCVFEKLADYPILRLLDAGIPVTVNTDNMTVSGVTLRSELERLMDTFSLTAVQLQTLVRNAAEAAFADEDTKAWLREELKSRFG